MTLGPVIRTGRRPAAPPRRNRTTVVAEWNHWERESAVNNWSTKCANNPEPYLVDVYSISAEQAMALCKPCPLMVLCAEYARVTKADGVVRGGIVWSEGKPFVLAPPVRGELPN